LAAFVAFAGAAFFAGVFTAALAGAAFFAGAFAAAGAFAFRGFDAGELRAADGAMMTMPPATAEKNGSHSAKEKVLSS